MSLSLRFPRQYNLQSYITDLASYHFQRYKLFCVFFPHTSSLLLMRKFFYRFSGVVLFIFFVTFWFVGFFNGLGTSTERGKQVRSKQYELRMNLIKDAGLGSEKLGN